ncbi:hypothetical protein GALMADRAFT_259000 [Galerina marginata CBS 339.88]|uniref:Heterokaryon incompatibility domain-containing protein n=1 Tax=Galerina marginata (strain CBS 339.88) TaxID=685588 RepID=A0A067S6P4_GALM3|nr:hypothetical protein GALMADRAFT_259000 [Galerina marginata CBS 339.88]
MSPLDNDRETEFDVRRPKDQDEQQDPNEQEISDEPEDSGEQEGSDEQEDWSEEEDPDDPDIMIPPLLPIPQSLAKPNDRLCNLCEALDLTPRRFVVLPDDDDLNDVEVQLGLVQDIKKSSSCPFCRLVLAAVGSNVPAFDDGEPVSITLTWQEAVDEPDHLMRNYKDDNPPYRVLTPKVVSPGSLSGWKQLHDNPQITLLTNDAPANTPANTHFLRPIGDKIDFAMVRNWLLMCERWHGDICKQSKMLDHVVDDVVAEIPSLRLIDVVDNCIVSAPPNCQYVALSYVWGRIDPETILRTLKANVVELEQRGSLVRSDNHSRIPLTIRDAMEVVRELRLRYLWVDSLCIIQDDIGKEGSKMDAISKMDIVYGAAFLTITAGTGVDANAGLPGLRPGTQMQVAEQILPGLRLALGMDYNEYVLKAVYSTRAWTYQEQQFSRRRLVFIGGQVVYECLHADGWCEDKFCERRKNAGNGKFEMNGGKNINKHEDLIKEYSSRSLTHEEDIYDAFAGITRYFRTSLKVNLCHGIPDAYFDWFLLWVPLSPQKRREIAPSWSWAGWIGPSGSHIWLWYEGVISTVRKAQSERTWIIWYQRTAHTSTECVKVWQHSSSESRSRNFYGVKTKDRHLFNRSETLPTPQTLIKAPEYIQDNNSPAPGSGFLQFWTVSVMFEVGPPTSEYLDSVPLNGCYRLGIFGHNGREVGTVIFNAEWPSAKPIHKTHEFILLCEGKDGTGKGSVHSTPWVYKVMLIEWHGKWAERIALGSIGKSDLREALPPGPVWKEIILG